MRTVLHVNQHIIKKNRKDGESNPVLTCKTYKENRKGNTAVLKDSSGNEVGRFVYRPERPLPCGAHVWFETKNEVEVLR